MIDLAGCVKEKPANGTVNTAKMFFGGENGNKGIEALISSRCAVESQELSRFAYFWQIPIINRHEDSDLNDNKLYPTLIQVNIFKRLK